MYTKRKFLKEYGQIIHAKHARIKVPVTWYSIVVTVLFLGRFPIAPGTLGSLAAYPLFYAAMKSSNSINEITSILLVLTVFFGIIGTISISVFQSKTNTHDHKCVVIDELVGQLFTLYLALPFINPLITLFQGSLNISSMNWIFLICFVLFRFFDIFKPFPIGRVDRAFKNSVGVMVDDLLASLYAFCVVYVMATILNYAGSF